VKTDYDGATLIDSAGERVGTVERSYLDDNGIAQYLEVKSGTIVHRHYLVPADQAEVLPEGVRVPYTRDMIEESPNAMSDDTLEGPELSEIRAYYES
jgi:hypothetical protein